MERSQENRVPPKTPISEIKKQPHNIMSPTDAMFSPCSQKLMGKHRKPAQRMHVKKEFVPSNLSKQLQ